MCGIAGYFQPNAAPAAVAARLRRMADAQCHRGPDQHGFALFTAAAAHASPDGDFPAAETQPALGGFAHQRLSILDLSDAGRQPMASADGCDWLCFNGEIYNFRELRVELEAAGIRFHSTSDTEVLLHLLRRRGREALPACNGMWAFAWWNQREQTLFLCRDRFGIKPLYYWQEGNRFAFASEIKALLALPDVSSEPYEPAIADYLVHGRVDCFDFTFFKGIRALPPGHCAAISFAGGTPRMTITPWWNLAEAVDAVDTASLSFGEAAERLRGLLTDSIQLRLRSDVPVGTCLSGGLDSSAVVCLAAPHLSAANQNTFSACYRDFAKDESRWIRMVVEATGVRPHTVYPDGAGFRQDVRRLLHHQDQPFTSTSIYAQWKVFELSRRTGVIVTLDGQGADETLAGYDYFFPVYYAQLLKAGRLFAWAGACRSRAARQHTSALREALGTAGGFLNHRTMTRMAGLVSAQYRTDWVAPRLRAAARGLRSPQPLPRGEQLNQRLAEVFTSSGLPALLRYADRNSMAHSVESRMPFMDWRLVTFLLALPASYKLRDGESKAVFREALRGVIPEPVRARQDKIGFETPEADWFRTVLRPDIAEFAESASLGNSPWFDAPRLRDLWRRHAAGSLNASRPLWRAWCLHLWQAGLHQAP